jgi:hypothetical protein
MNFVSLEQENTHSNYLIQNLINSGWLQPDTVLVNVVPEYSSRLTQLINQKTSFLNRNELFEQINLSVPPKGMSQVYSYEAKAYITFDKYLLEWVNRYVTPSSRFLFIKDTTFTGRSLNKIRLVLKSKLEEIDQMRFLSLYCQQDSVLVPDFVHRKFEKENPPVYFWQNTHLIK